MICCPSSMLWGNHSKGQAMLDSSPIHYSKQGMIALRASVFRETLGPQILFFRTKKPHFFNFCNSLSLELVYM